MGKNERIIAQDLAEIRHALQTNDLSKILELCEILTKEIKKYHVKPDVVDRLEKVSGYSDSPSIVFDEKINEINNLIEILTSSR